MRDAADPVGGIPCIFALPLARSIGATVIATSSSDEKLEWTDPIVVIDEAVARSQWL